MYSDIFESDDFQTDFLNMSTETLSFDLPGYHEGWTFDEPDNFQNQFPEQNSENFTKSFDYQSVTGEMEGEEEEKNMKPAVTGGSPVATVSEPSTFGERSSMGMYPSSSGISLQPTSGISLQPSPSSGISLQPSHGISLQPSVPDENAHFAGGYYMPQIVEDEASIFDTRSAKKKRKRSNALPDPNQLTSAFDHEDALSQLSSDEFLEYTTIAGVHRRFSEEERTFLDKILKKIKNRECARRSRANKKNKLKALEKSVVAKDHEIAALKAENELLKKENSDLRSQVSYFTSMLNYRRPQENSNPQELYTNPFGSQTNTVLFIFLFTFGLMLNLDSSNFNMFNAFSSNIENAPVSPYVKEMISPSQNNLNSKDILEGPPFNDQNHDLRKHGV